MNNLYILTETYTNGFRIEILGLISLIAIICGIFVIITKNPIISVLFLIGLFLSISGYLIFLFILMLINIRISELLNETSNTIPLAIISTIAFNYSIYQILPYNIAIFNSYTININNIFYDIFYYNYNNYLNKTFKFNDDIIYFVTSKA